MGASVMRHPVALNSQSVQTAHGIGGNDNWQTIAANMKIIALEEHFILPREEQEPSPRARIAVMIAKSFADLNVVVAELLDVGWRPSRATT